MNQTPKKTATPARCRVAIVSASWHRDIVEQAVQSARAELGRLRPDNLRIDELIVPGAFEIPLIARRMASSGRVDAGGGLVLVAVGSCVDTAVATASDGWVAAAVPARSTSRARGCRRRPAASSAPASS